LVSIFGKTLAVKQAESLSYLLESKTGEYQISFQDRQSNIGYFNKLTNKQFISDPISLANNKSIISKFDSCQACYIGILAGIFMERTKILNDGGSSPRDGSQSKVQLEHPKLRVIK